MLLSVYNIYFFLISYSYYFYSDWILSIFDLLLAPIYLIVIFFIASYIQNRNIDKHPLYKWYTKGLMVKLFGAVSVCLIYQLYYTGGDTVNYFITSKALSNMLFKNYKVFFDIVFNGNNSYSNYMAFDNSTGFPVFWRDEKALFVSRLVTPLCLLSFQSFVVTAILLAWLCYTGIWRFFQLFNQQFPQLQKQFAISILFVPSVVFWGSGLLKDTITLSAVGWFTFHFYNFFIRKKYKIWSVLSILVASFLLIAIKPYILFALLPGAIIWLTNEKLVKIKRAERKER